NRATRCRHTRRNLPDGTGAARLISALALGISASCEEIGSVLIGAFILQMTRVLSDQFVVKTFLGEGSGKSASICGSHPQARSMNPQITQIDANGGVTWG